jgi:hypothetical protein
MKARFGDVFRYSTSKWLCLIVSTKGRTSDLTMVTLVDDEDQTADMEMYDLGKPFRWGLPDTSWQKVETRE